ncbi:MAG: polyprenyl synthetase family protein [Bacteroidales bacterium]|nr:polyprenyl synthetase family protein [Bacteroidales bacterium]
MKTLEQEFQAVLADKKPANLYEPISYILMQPGKRLRPQLVHMAVDLFDGSYEQAQLLASAFEMLHNFTLIHDDIMDMAPIRRGKATVYKKWNSNIAILSGDALAIMAFQQLLKLDCDNQIVIDIAKVFSETSLEICEGQQFDLDFETQKTVTIDEYINMIRLKTAVMFAGCLKAGSILVSADAESQQALYDFGIDLGIAFQLADDNLDVYADVATFGKTVGGDIRDNKKTFLYLKALELASAEQKQQLQQWFSTPTTDFEGKYEAVKQIFDDLGVRKVTDDEVLRYVNKALADLDRVHAGEEKKKALHDLAVKLINREK